MSGMPWKKPLNSAAQTQQGVEALLLRLILLFARELAHGVTTGVRDPDTCVTSCCCCKDVCMAVPCGLKDTLKASDWPGCPHCCRAWCRRWSQRAQRRERQLPCSCRRRCRARSPDSMLEPGLFHLGRACALPFRGQSVLRGSRQFPGMRLESHSDLGSQVSRDPCGRAVLGINQLRAPPKAWRPLENSKREFLAAKKSSKKCCRSACATR